MSCLNCNRETTGTNVFCEQCQQAMVDFPVPKGTPVTILIQPTPVVSKKQTSHRFASAEDQLAAAHRTSRCLAVGLILSSILLLAAAAAIVYLALYGMPDFLLIANS